MFKKLNFSTPSNRPFFYTSFVSTIDGKVWVKKSGYWPIGSKVDYQYFTFLRAHADAIVDGKNTALTFGSKTIETLHREEFRLLRKKLGNKTPVKYFVVTSKPDSRLAASLKNPYGFQPTILTTGQATVSKDIEKVSTIARITKDQCMKVSAICDFLHQEKKRTVFIDGGPTLIASFLEANLLDEIFLTIAPKIIGNSENTTVTMVEGKLFPKNRIKTARLLSFKKIDDELFLRYKVQHSIKSS